MAQVAIALTFLTSSCFNPPGGGGGAKGAFTKAASILSGTSNGGSDQQVVAGTLAIGESIIADMASSLKLAGLSDVQITAVQDSARRELAAGVVAIQSNTMNLTVDMLGQPVEYAAPAVVRGAVAGLALVGAGNVDLKANAVQAIVGSSFKSLSGKTDVLPTANLQNLATTMAGGAVSKLREAGFASSDVGQAAKSVTSGSIANLQAAGISSEAMAGVAKAVVTGSVTQLANINLPAGDIAGAVAGAAEGAVSSISTTGLNQADTAQLAGTLTAASVQTLTAFKGASQSVLLDAMQDISKGAVAALQTANISNTFLGSAVEAIASGSVAAISSVSESSGFGSNLITNGAAAVASGAISGLTAVSQKSDSSVTAAATQSIITGTMASLATSSSLNLADKSAAAASVVGKSVEALSTLGSEATKTAAMGSVIGTTMASLQSLGIAADAKTTASTVQAITSNATSALGVAGFTGSNLAAASQSVVSTTVQGIDKLNVSSATDIGNLLSNVLSGVSSGYSALTKSGKADENAVVAAINSSAQTATSAVSTLKSASNLSTTEIASVAQQVAAAAPATVTYAVTELKLALASAMTALEPTRKGSFSDCSASPALPVGLTLSATCTITGTPAVVIAPQKYVITPKGGAPSGIVISVSTNLPSIAYAQSDYQLVGGATAVSIVPTVTGGGVTSCLVNQPLPPGLALTSSCVISGNFDFLSPDRYDPVGLIVLGEDGNVVSSPVEGRDQGYRFRVPFTITPENSFGVGPGVNITLTATPPFSIYPSNNYDFDLYSTSTQITISPTISLSNLTNCTITPNLPAGLDISTATCLISGIGSAPFASTVYQVTTSKSDGTQILSRFRFSLNRDPYGMYFPMGNSYTGTIGDTFSVVPSFSQMMPTSCAISPTTLPAGLTKQSDCSIQGTPTAASAAVKYTLTPSGPAGEGKPLDFNLKIMSGINVTGTVGNSAVNLSWLPVSGASNYVVVAHQNGGVMTQPNDGIDVANLSLASGDILVYAGANTSVSHSNLGTGINYNYRVFAQNSSKIFIAQGGAGPFSIGNQTQYYAYYQDYNYQFPAGSSISISPVYPTALTSTAYSTGIAGTTTSTSTVGTASPVPSSCSVTPALPPGLSLSNQCVISGTVTAPVGANQHEITPSSTGVIWGKMYLSLKVSGPISLTAVPNGPTGVNLSWPAVLNATNYVVIAHQGGGVATTGANGRQIAQVNAAPGDIVLYSGNGLNFSHAGLVAGQVYRYRVFASSGYYDYVAYGAAGPVTVGVTNMLPMSYSSREYTLSEGSQVTIEPAFEGNPADSCVSVPELPEGLSLSSGCIISGPPVEPSWGKYLITPSRYSVFGAAVEITLRVMELMGVTPDTNLDRYVELSWGSLLAPSNYVVMASPTVPHLSFPPDSITYHVGDQTLWGVVIYDGADEMAAHENLLPGAKYYYTVFGYSFGTGYTSRGSIGPVTVRQKFDGIQDMYLVAPPMGGAQGPVVATTWQPFDSGQYYGYQYNGYLSTGAQSVDLSTPTYPNWDSFMPAIKQLPNSGQTSLVVRSAYSADDTDNNEREFKLDTRPMTHHKIYGRGRYLGEKIEEVFIQKPTAATVDARGNALFATTNGTVNVICYESWDAPYCRNRQIGHVYSVAGSDGIDSGAARPADPWPPWMALGVIKSIAVDKFFNIYMFDSMSRQIIAMCNGNSPSAGACAGSGLTKGSMIVVAGNRSPGAPNLSVPALESPLGGEVHLALDGSSNILFGQSDQPNLYVICTGDRGPYCGDDAKVAGNTYLIAGTQNTGDSIGSTALSSTIGNPAGLAVDQSDNLYMSDSTNSRVRVLCANSAVLYSHVCAGKVPMSMHNFAGNGSPSNGTGNDVALNTAIGAPGPLAVDQNSNVYVQDNLNMRLRVVCQNVYGYGPCLGKTAQSTYVAAFGGAGDSVTPQAPNAALAGNVSGIGVDNGGNVFIADGGANRLRAICFTSWSMLCQPDTRPTGQVYPLSGIVPPTNTDSFVNAANEPLKSQRISSVLDQVGNLYIADPDQRRIFVQCMNQNGSQCANSMPGQRKAVAGSGVSGASPTDGTSLSAANLTNIRAIAVDADGNLAVALGDPDYKIYMACFNAVGPFCAGRVVNKIYLYAGSGQSFAAADNQSPLSTSVGEPSSLNFDSQGNLLVYDQRNSKVYQICMSISGTCQGRLAPNLYVMSVAGVGVISQMAISNDGSGLLLADRSQNKIWLTCFSASGICAQRNLNSIYLWAGDGTVDDSVNNTTLNALKVSAPSGIALTQQGDVLIQTSVNPRIWLVCMQDSFGICTGKTVGNAYHLAGTGSPGNASSNTLASQASFGLPQGVSNANEFNRLSIDRAKGHIYSSDGMFGTIRVILGAVGSGP